MAVEGYQASVEEAEEALEAARAALTRDLAQAVANAGWENFLRDRFDVAALVAQISETAEDNAFRSKLHAAGDKMRTQSRQRGRPKKAAVAQPIGNGSAV